MLKRRELISDDYLAQQKAMHMDPRGYGGKGKRWADVVVWVAKYFDCRSVLDYGCGEGSLRAWLPDKALYLGCREYDPAIAGKDGPPAFADLVVCTDVLEHIEPDRIGKVLEHIHSLARKAIFLVVSLRDANKTLPDGRNAHLLVRPPAWWEAKIDEHGWEIADLPDLPIPAKVSREKQWIAVVRPRR
jgi:hypothetical protein